MTSENQAPKTWVKLTAAEQEELTDLLEENRQARRGASSEMTSAEQRIESDLDAVSDADDAAGRGHDPGDDRPAGECSTCEEPFWRGGDCKQCGEPTCVSCTIDGRCTECDGGNISTDPRDHAGVWHYLIADAGQMLGRIQNASYIAGTATSDQLYAADDAVHALITALAKISRGKIAPVKF